MSENNNGNRKQDIEIATIQTDISWIRGEITSIKDNHLNSIYKKIDKIEKRYDKKPSWAVSIIIALLSSASLALLVFVLTS